MYDQDLLDRYDLVATGANAGRVCGSDWVCPNHGLICELREDDEYKHRWARVERRMEARSQAIVETTPDVD